MDVRKLKYELSETPDICKVFLVLDGKRIALSEVCYEVSSSGGRVVLYAEGENLGGDDE